MTHAGPAFGSSRAEITRIPGGEREEDRVAVEEPLEIRINGTAVAVTMRTPGNDEELALGFCLSEGFGRSPLRCRTISRRTPSR